MWLLAQAAGPAPARLTGEADRGWQALRLNEHGARQRQLRRQWWHGQNRGERKVGQRVAGSRGTLSAGPHSLSWPQPVATNDAWMPSEKQSLAIWLPAAPLRGQAAPR